MQTTWREADGRADALIEFVELLTEYGASIENTDHYLDSVRGGGSGRLLSTEENSFSEITGHCNIASYSMRINVNCPSARLFICLSILWLVIACGNDRRAKMLRMLHSINWQASVRLNIKDEGYD